DQWPLSVGKDGELHAAYLCLARISASEHDDPQPRRPARPPLHRLYRGNDRRAGTGLSGRDPSGDPARYQKLQHLQPVGCDAQRAGAVRSAPLHRQPPFRPANRAARSGPPATQLLDDLPPRHTPYAPRIRRDRFSDRQPARTRGDPQPSRPARRTRTSRTARRRTVNAAPVATSHSAAVRTCPCQPARGSNIDRPAAAVITAIRCCFAIGPLKSAPAPQFTPSSRKYAVRKAMPAAAQPSAGSPTASAAPIRISRSDTRSGNSFQ